MNAHRCRHRRLAGAFAAALAEEKKAEPVTGDPEFKALEKEIKVAGLKQSLLANSLRIRPRQPPLKARSHGRLWTWAAPIPPPG